MKAGTFVFGNLVPVLPSQVLAPMAMAVHNQIYEVKVTVQPVPPNMESSVVNSLMAMRVPGMKVLAVEVRGNYARLQVKANQFEWMALFAALPSILGPLGLIIISALIVFQVPSWAWAAIPLSVGGGILLYAIYKAKK